MTDYTKWRKSNPWMVLNLQNSQASSGRFPTREKAVEHGETYRGGVVDVNDFQKIVYVSEMPSL